MKTFQISSYDYYLGLKVLFQEILTRFKDEPIVDDGNGPQMVSDYLVENQEKVIEEMNNQDFFLATVALPELGADFPVSTELADLQLSEAAYADKWYVQEIISATNPPLHIEQNPEGQDEKFTAKQLFASLMVDVTRHYDQEIKVIFPRQDLTVQYSDLIANVARGILETRYQKKYTITSNIKIS